MPLSEHVVEDYLTTGLSLKAHPCSFFRDDSSKLGAITSREHRERKAERRMRMSPSPASS